MVGTAGLLPVTPLAHMAEVAGGKASPPDLSPFVTLADFEAAARERMPESVFAYVSSGAADEITLRRNLESYQRILLDARVLADVGQLDLSTKLLSRRLASPVLFAPTASNAAVHRGGEVAVARGAGRTGTTYVLSTSSNTAVEDVTRAASEPVWFQLYVHPDLTAAMDLIRRAEAAGCEAICVTVDTPLPGLRDRQARAEFDPRAGGLTYPHLDWAQARSPTAKRKPGEPRRLVWDEIARLARQTRVPLLLKGIMHHDDARRAIDVGAAGVIVSNHGGRSIDTLPATIEALPGIVAAVGGRIPVLMDGGIRRGTDVVKAIALGATAVLIGRPYLYGLAVAGADGVARVQEILLGELRHSLALLGRPSIASLDRSALWQTPAQLEGSLRGQTAAPR